MSNKSEKNKKASINKNEKNDETEHDIRYEKAKQYWENRNSTIEDMLGGFPEVNDIDVKVSKKLLEDLIKSKKLDTHSVIDCGAGIGRVTDKVLQHYFNECDLVEMNPKFTNYAKDYFKNNLKIKNVFCSPIQNFIFPKKYDCIWIQWCLENLDDKDLNIFFTNCHRNLNDNGLIIIKENIEENYDYSISETDYSKVRSDKIFRKFFEKQKFLIYRQLYHPFWPSDLMKVSIYVLYKTNLI